MSQGYPKHPYALALFLLSFQSNNASQQTQPLLQLMTSERAASPIFAEPPSPTPTIAYSEEMLAEYNDKKRKQTEPENEERAVRARTEDVQQHSVSAYAPAMSSNEQMAQEFYETGQRYYHGTTEVVKNLETAITMWKEAARRGHTKAQEVLENLSNIIKSQEFGQQEAKTSSAQALAAVQNSSSMMYAASAAASSSSIAQAAPASSSNSLALSIPELEKTTEAFNLGACYKTGLGVKKDLKKAANLYQQTAAKGFPPAQFALGSLYETGQGVQKDLQEAIKLYQKAAESGLPKAQQALARLKKVLGANRKQ